MMLVKLKRRSGRKFRGSKIAVHRVFHNVAVMSLGKRISIESANRTTATNDVSQQTLKQGLGAMGTDLTRHWQPRAPG